MAMTRIHLPVVQAMPPMPPVSGDPLVDHFARRIRYLRVSVTDRCNYRCTYCMPEELGDQLQFHAKSAVLTFEEITRLVTIFAGLGVRKIRLTGGEPTVRQGIGELVALCRYAWSRGAVPRFIEHMPMSGGQLYADAAELTAAQIRAAIEGELGPLVPSQPSHRDAGPARYWSLAADSNREVGIIS